MCVRPVPEATGTVFSGRYPSRRRLRSTLQPLLRRGSPSIYRTRPAVSGPSCWTTVHCCHGMVAAIEPIVAFESIALQQRGLFGKQREDRSKTAGGIPQRDSTSEGFV